MIDGIATIIFFGRCYTKVGSGGLTTHGRYHVVSNGKPLLIAGRCYSHLADGISTFWVDLFQFKFCDVKQNLIPYVRQMVFAYVLDRDGLFTLMYIASLIALITFWFSLPIMMKLSMVVL